MLVKILAVLASSGATFCFERQPMLSVFFHARNSRRRRAFSLVEILIFPFSSGEFIQDENIWLKGIEFLFCSRLIISGIFHADSLQQISDDIL